MQLLIFACLCALSSVLAFPDHKIDPILRQLQEQSGNGQYLYGFDSKEQSRSEQRTADGVTHGSYSYLDSNGIVQHVEYTAGEDGFHASGSNLPVASGPVQETPEVLVARAQHEAAVAYSKSLVPNVPQNVLNSFSDDSHLNNAFSRVHEPLHNQLQHNTAPTLETGAVGDTPEVAAAKAQHAAAHAAIRRILPELPQEPVQHNTFPQIHQNTFPHVDQNTFPQVHQNTFPQVQQNTFPQVHESFPVQHQTTNQQHTFDKFAEEIPLSELGETPEVAAARAEHFAAHAAVSKILPKISSSTPVPIFHHIEIPLDQLDQFQQDTPEVAAAKAQHAAAVAAIQSNGQHRFAKPSQSTLPLLSPDGHLQDTPEIAAAKAQHFAAVAAARGYTGAF